MCYGVFVACPLRHIRGRGPSKMGGTKVPPGTEGGETPIAHLSKRGIFISFAGYIYFHSNR